MRRPRRMQALRWSHVFASRVFEISRFADLASARYRGEAKIAVLRYMLTAVGQVPRTQQALVRNRRDRIAPWRTRDDPRRLQTRRRRPRRRTRRTRDAGRVGHRIDG